MCLRGGRHWLGVSHDSSNESSSSDEDEATDFLSDLLDTGASKNLLRSQQSQPSQGIVAATAVTAAAATGLALSSMSGYSSKSSSAASGVGASGSSSYDGGRDGEIAGAVALADAGEMGCQLHPSLKFAFERSGLAAGEQEAFARALTAQEFAPGSYIVRQGDSAALGELFIVTEGEVVVTRNASAAEIASAPPSLVIAAGTSDRSCNGCAHYELIVAHLYEGHVFGEAALLEEGGGLRNANVRVLAGAVQCLALSRMHFAPFLARNPAFRAMVGEVVKGRAAAAARRAELLRAHGGAVAPPEERRHDARVSQVVVKGRTPEGRRVINGYVLLRRIGRGAFGTVYLASSLAHDKQYAIKVVSRSLLRRQRQASTRAQPGSPAPTADDLFREAVVMKRLAHPNVVALYELIDDPAAGCVYLVQEFCELGPALASEGVGAAALPASLARRYTRDMLQGLSYLHSQGIVHRDVKPQNLLIGADGRARLADFGTAAIVGSGDRLSLRDVAGTPAFQPPELFGDCCGGSSDNGCSDVKTYAARAVDVWAVGVTLHWLVTGETPFPASNELELAERLRNEDFVPVATAVRQDPHLRHLLQRCLTRDPTRRATLADVMVHDWITEEGVSPLPIMNYVPLGLTTQAGMCASGDASRSQAAVVQEASVAATSIAAAPISAALSSQTCVQQALLSKLPPRADDGEHLSIAHAPAHLPIASPTAASRRSARRAGAAPCSGSLQPAATASLQDASQRAWEASQEHARHLRALRARQRAAMDRHRVSISDLRPSHHPYLLSSAAVIDVTLDDLGIVTAPTPSPAVAPATDTSVSEAKEGEQKAFADSRANAGAVLKRMSNFVMVKGGSGGGSGGGDGWGTADDAGGSCGGGGGGGGAPPSRMVVFTKPERAALQQHTFAGSVACERTKAAGPSKQASTRLKKFSSSIIGRRAAAMLADQAASSAGSCDEVVGGAGIDRDVASLGPPCVPRSPLPFEPQQPSCKPYGSGSEGEQGPSAKNGDKLHAAASIDAAGAPVVGNANSSSSGGGGVGGGNQDDSDSSSLRSDAEVVDDCCSHDGIRELAPALCRLLEGNNRHVGGQDCWLAFEADADLAPLTDDEAVQWRRRRRTGDIAALGLTYGLAETAGARPTMEDRSVACAPLLLQPPLTVEGSNDKAANLVAPAALFCMFDGHNGSRVAALLAEQLPARIRSALTPGSEDEIAQAQAKSAPSRAESRTLLSRLSCNSASHATTDVERAEANAIQPLSAVRRTTSGFSGSGCKQSSSSLSSPQSFSPQSSLLTMPPPLLPPSSSPLAPTSQSHKIARSEAGDGAGAVSDSSDIAELRFVYDALSDAFLDMDDACLADCPSVAASASSAASAAAAVAAAAAEASKAGSSAGSFSKMTARSIAEKGAGGVAAGGTGVAHMMRGGGSAAGSTALAVLLRAYATNGEGGGSNGALTAFCANAGDSRAVLCRGGTKVDLSFDHVCSRPDEAARITDAGGRIVGGRLFGVLAVSRAMGDADYKAAIPGGSGGGTLIANPEIVHERLGSCDEFIIIACDGVWDVLSSQQAVDCVRRALFNTEGDAARAARVLIDKALARGSTDNCSAIVVCLNPVLE